MYIFETSRTGIFQQQQQQQQYQPLQFSFPLIIGVDDGENGRSNLERRSDEEEAKQKIRDSSCRSCTRLVGVFGEKIHARSVQRVKKYRKMLHIQDGPKVLVRKYQPKQMASTYVFMFKYGFSF